NKLHADPFGMSDRALSVPHHVARDVDRMTVRIHANPDLFKWLKIKGRFDKTTAQTEVQELRVRGPRDRTHVQDFDREVIHPRDPTFPPADVGEEKRHTNVARNHDEHVDLNQNRNNESEPLEVRVTVLHEIERVQIDRKKLRDPKGVPRPMAHPLKPDS